MVNDLLVVIDVIKSI